MGTYDDIGNWSVKDLNDYALGKMNPSRRQDLESEMLDNPFLEQAVQGYVASEGMLANAGLNHKWDAIQGETDSVTVAGIYAPLAIGAGIIIVLGIAWTFFQKSEVNEMAEEVQESMLETINLQEFYADSLYYMDIQLARPINEKEEIKPEIAIKAQSELKVFEQELRELREGPSLLQPFGSDSVNEVLGKELKTSVPEVFFVYGLKLADYREDYEDELFFQGDFLSITAAQYKHENKGITQVSEIKRVAYESIMSEAMMNFSRRKYKETLVILTRIEKKHPNDVNAAFYGGLCYYNLSKWQKADLRFRLAKNHPRRVFGQEAQWYLALSLIRQQRIDKTELILKEIVKNKGFYAEKAAVLLGL